MKRILEGPRRLRVPWLLVLYSIVVAQLGAILVVTIGSITHLQFGHPLGEMRFWISLPFGIVAFPFLAVKFINGWLVEWRIVGLLYARSDGAVVTISNFLGSRFRPQIQVPTGTTLYVEVTPKLRSDGKYNPSTKWEVFGGRQRIRFRTYFEPDTAMLDALCRELRHLGLVPNSRVLGPAVANGGGRAPR